jgi:HlyD family secretion protein
LARQGAVSQDDADQAITNEATAQATVGARKSAVDSARKQLVAAEGNLTQAKTNAYNPGIRTSQWLNAQRQLKVSQSALKSAEQEINNTKAACDEIRANIAYLNLPSPIHGIVTARSVEPGAVVSAGQTVLACINLDTVYLRGFVPDKEIGRVRVGQRADIFLDAMPKQAFPGKVIEIDPVASFTPENIYFKDDRVKQTFGIKIAFDDPQRFPKPGMPADAYIYTDLPEQKKPL